MWPKINITKRQWQIFVAVTILIIGYCFSEIFSTGRGFDGDRVVIWVFDIGQGDAIFINAPGKQVLIDGGPDDLVLEKLSAVLPFWDRSIDLVVSTHPHADHVAGLVSVLDRHQIGEVWISPASYQTSEYLEFLRRSDVERVPEVGEIVDLGSGAQLRVIYVPSEPFGTIFTDPNDASIVLELVDGETTMLLTGDAGVEQEQKFTNGLGHIDVLKVGHHGSGLSTGRELLEMVTPDVGIISVGENDYGLPDLMTVDRLKRKSIKTFRTDQDGDVRIITIGGEPEIKLFEL